MPSVLIIAYGNPLRSDDGLAWHAAKAIEGKFGSSEVEILCPTSSLLSSRKRELLRQP